MDARTLAWAAVLMAVAVAFGAFGAHGLKAMLEPEALTQWHTGVQYQFLHALGLLALAAMGDRLPARTMRLTTVLFLLGILLFSGSLYLLSTRDVLSSHGLTSVLGPLTPLGGLCFIAGWVTLLITALRMGAKR